MRLIDKISTSSSQQLTNLTLIQALEQTSEVVEVSDSLIILLRNPQQTRNTTHFVAKLYAQISQAFDLPSDQHQVSSRIRISHFSGDTNNFFVCSKIKANALNNYAEHKGAD